MALTNGSKSVFEIPYESMSKSGAVVNVHGMRFLEPLMVETKEKAYLAQPLAPASRPALDNQPVTNPVVILAQFAFTLV